MKRKLAYKNGVVYHGVEKARKTNKREREREGIILGPNGSIFFNVFISMLGQFEDNVEAEMTIYEVSNKSGVDGIMEEMRWWMVLRK